MIFNRVACAACSLCSLCVLQQYVPLFLTKEDLDVAVSGAYRQRNAAQISAVKDKVGAAVSRCDSAHGLSPQSWRFR